jgi:hypothetical protein
VAPFALLGSLLALLAWSFAARAAPEPCPARDGSWVEVVFSGPAWSAAEQDSVIRELRVELERRSLGVCPRPETPPVVAPQKVITLLANDAERVSIVASNLENEGGFTGRTIAVSTIPEDARALAIAQAVDEALRSGEDDAPKAPVAPPTPSKQRVTEPRLQDAAASEWSVAAALAPTLQVALPSFAGATRAVVAPGVALRLGLNHTHIGVSMGLGITRVSDFTFADTPIRGLRSPADVSLSLRLSRGEAQGTLDLGIEAALSDYESASTARGYSVVDFGGRAGLRLGWGRRVIPWLGASLEALSSSHALTFAPSGEFGRTPTIWLGFALGVEVRWP